MRQLGYIAFLLFTSMSYAQIVNPANGHTYVLIPQLLTYPNARTQATALGGYLVAINDSAENSFVQNAFSAFSGFNSGADDNAWIGLSDELIEGAFVWDSQEPITYTNWTSSNPSNSNGIEDYTEIMMGAATQIPGQWNDIGPTATNYPIVEIPIPSIGCALYLGGQGQSNGSTARLEINGCGAGPLPGPFVVTTAPLQPITFAWQGAPLMPIILVTGPMNPSPFTLPGFGTIHIGTQPLFNDVLVVFDGAHMSGGLQLTTSPTGTASQTVIVPAGTPPGTQIAVQGIVEQVAGTTTYGNLLTAAFRIDVQ